LNPSASYKRRRDLRKRERSRDPKRRRKLPVGALAPCAVAYHRESEARSFETDEDA